MPRTDTPAYPAPSQLEMRVYSRPETPSEEAVYEVPLNVRLPPAPPRPLPHTPTLLGAQAVSQHVVTSHPSSATTAQRIHITNNSDDRDVSAFEWDVSYDFPYSSE